MFRGLGKLRLTPLRSSVKAEKSFGRDLFTFSMHLTTTMPDVQ